MILSEKACEEGSVTLNSEHEVLLCYSGLWQLICSEASSQWGNQDAGVVCKQLGYSGELHMLWLTEICHRIWENPTLVVHADIIAS